MFFRELKRRNVFKVAIAYLTAAWLLIQVTETLVLMLTPPDWVPRLVVLLLAIGFLPALIIAWAYELTPGGIRCDRDVDRSQSAGKVAGRKLDFAIIAMLALAIAYLLVDRYVFVSPPDAVGKSIAVLPFINISDDAGNEYFSEGMSDEIRNLLGQIPDLKVIGRTSSHKFKGKEEDIRTIGQMLGVATLLEGSVRKSGDRVRITTQLIDAADGAEMWSKSYDRILTDIFAVQDAVAGDVIAALKIRVGVSPSRGHPTENLDAYDLFLRARDATRAFDYGRAEDMLKKATGLDPEFAEAYEALAYLYWISADTRDAVESQQLVRAASTKAVALDPRLVYARIYARTSTPGFEYRKGTVEALDQALSEQPDNTQILESLTFLLAETGYLGASLRLAEHFVQVDPLSLIAHAHLALGLYSVGRNDAAIEAAQFVLNSEPMLNSFTWAIVGMLLMEDHDEAAIRYVEFCLAQQGLSDTSWFRDLVTHAGDPATGQAYLDRRIPEITADLSNRHSLLWDEEQLALYLYFGFLDRHFELVMATEPTDQTWHYAGVTCGAALYSGNTASRTTRPTWASSNYSASTMSGTIADRRTFAGEAMGNGSVNDRRWTFAETRTTLYPLSDIARAALHL